jgi:type I site-specific restriction endonuclease
MTPEALARESIDRKLAQAGWVVQDMKALNLGAATGVAVREHPTDTGPADYVLFVHRQPVGVIEAKKDSAGENLTVTESQTERYASANLKWRKDNTPLRFLFDATGHAVRRWPQVHRALQRAAPGLAQHRPARADVHQHHPAHVFHFEWRAHRRIGRRPVAERGATNRQPGHRSIAARSPSTSSKSCTNSWPNHR